MELQQHQHGAVKSPRHKAYSNACRSIYKAMSDYYSQQTFEPKKTPEELRVAVIEIVKDFDRRITSQLAPVSEAEFVEYMNNWTNNYLSNFQEIMMIKEMTSSLSQLQQFRDQTDFMGENDLNLLQQLIKFVEKIPTANISYPHLQPEFVKHVRLYHDRLFIPIKKTIIRQEMVNAQAQGIMQPKRMHTQMHPNEYSPSFTLNQMNDRGSQKNLKRGNSSRSPSPSGRRNCPNRSNENTSQPTPEAFLKRLFGYVRTDCAVFYSTPHPPHF